MGDERNRLNKIIDDHGLNIEHVQVMERRDQSYSRVYDALAAKLAEVDAARSAVIRMSVAEISDLKAALKTARRDALEEAAKECDRLAGQPAMYNADRRKAAGQCGAAIRALIEDWEDVKTTKCAACGVAMTFAPGGPFAPDYTCPTCGGQDAILAKLDPDALIVAALEAASVKIQDVIDIGEKYSEQQYARGAKASRQTIRALAADPEARAAIKVKAGLPDAPAQPTNPLDDPRVKALADALVSLTVCEEPYELPLSTWLEVRAALAGLEKDNG